jgi:AcrR family transcriptional regulator
VTRILEGAYRLIRRDGTVDPSLRGLLAEVGLANRSFYRHFATKDEFLLVLLEDVQNRLTAFLAARMQDAGDDPVERVRAWVLGVLAQADDPDTAALGRPFLVQGPRLREAHPDVYRSSGGAMLDLLSTAIADAVAAGRMRSEDPRADARAIFHLALSLMQSHVLDRTAPTPAETAAVVDFALRAMR